jgi:hypothetical protein
MGLDQYIEIKRTVKADEYTIFNDIEFDNEVKSCFTMMNVTKMWKTLRKNYIFNSLIERAIVEPCELSGDLEIGKDELREMKQFWNDDNKEELKKEYLQYNDYDDETFEEAYNETKNILNEMKKLCNVDNTSFVYSTSY